MKLVSIRLITDDVQRLVSFYETATGTSATWSTPEFAELDTSGGRLAVASTATIALFGNGIAEASHNRSAIIEFLVEDVDARYDQIRQSVAELVQEPTTMPWGNRSLLFRDPDGNLVNFFTPVTSAAKEKFGV